MTEHDSAVAPLHAGQLGLGSLHAIEWAKGWQYAHTHRAADEEWAERDLPPDGPGWVRNKYAGTEGYERRTRVQVSYWMRSRPGMVPWDQPWCGPRGPLHDMTPSQWREHIRQLSRASEGPTDASPTMRVS
ncbi:hypothetical protein [Kribbella sp. NPDC004875]|uniref:hypothetical protein n=1 Tax=Kribbella sp. NPDC004875 TaxID=3364107 RepID=UPI0036C21515